MYLIFALVGCVLGFLDARYECHLERRTLWWLRVGALLAYVGVAVAVVMAREVGS